MRQRLREVLRKYGGLLFFGLAYFAFIRVTGLSLPCPVHFLTGIMCPGCGLTTMLLALADGDIESAFRANELLFVTGPLILAFVFYDEVLWVRTGRRSALPTWVWILLLLLFIVFTIERNLGFS